MEYTTGYQAAKILAQASQIKAGNDYTVTRIIDLDRRQIVWEDGVVR